MNTYKIHINQLSDIETEYLIIRNNKTYIPRDERNRAYRQFIQDVAEQGFDIIEGPNVVQPSYADLRRADYPPIEEQLDKIYHSGVNAWKTQIKEIKDRHPKAITGRTDIGPLPNWVYTAVENYRFNQQLNAYVDAVKRLEHYVLSEGRPEIRQDVVVETKKVFNEETGEIETVNVTENVVTQTAIEPLEATVEITTTNPETLETTTETVRNPLIVKDEEERAAAQAVVDATPQAVIDAISS